VPLLTDQKKISDEIKRSIFSMGFDTTFIQEVKGYFVLEGDILLRKDSLHAYNTTSRKPVTKQGRFPDLVSLENVHNIRVLIESTIPDSGDDNWRIGVQQAIDSWNNTQSHVKMYLVSSGPDISIRWDNEIELEDAVISQGEWPMAEKPGRIIYINLDAHNNRIFGPNEKKAIMIHELGHCIGLRHTNWASFAEEAGNPAIGIPGTPNSGINPDPNSIMNQNCPSCLVLSDYDIIAIQAIYPWQPVTIKGPTNLLFLNPSYTYTYTIDFGSSSPAGPYYWSISYNVGSGNNFTAPDPYITLKPVYVGNTYNGPAFLTIYCPNVQDQTYTLPIDLKFGYKLIEFSPIIYD
jgi:hypothetical protein